MGEVISFEKFKMEKLKRDIFKFSKLLAALQPWQEELLKSLINKMVEKD